MRAEHLAPAAVAAIACAFLALGLMLQRQMARQEQVLREILRMHQELLESIRLLERRQSLTGSQAPAGSAAGILVDSDAALQCRRGRLRIADRADHDHWQG